MGEKRGLRGLQAWCRIVTEGHKNVHVCDMSASWRDGLAFCALIHHFRPDLIDFDSLAQNNILYNNRLAFTVAEQHLGIPALLDAEDMLKYEEPDKLSIATYVSQYYQYFEGRGRAAEKRTSLKRPFVERAFTPTALPAKAPLKGFSRDEKCFKCRNRVFILERLMVDGKLYHRMCFQCYRCATVLRPGAYAKGDAEGTYECIVCPQDEPIPQKENVSPKVELKNANNEVNKLKDSIIEQKDIKILEENLNLNSSAKAARKVFMERELSNSGSFRGSLENSTEVETVSTSNIISRLSESACTSPVNSEESNVTSSQVDETEVVTAGKPELLKPFDEKCSNGVETATISKPLLSKKEIIEDKPQSERLQEDNLDLKRVEVVQETDSCNSNFAEEKNPTPPLRTRRKHHGSSIDLASNEKLEKPLKNDSSFVFSRKFNSTIELSKHKEATPTLSPLSSPTTTLPTITSPNYSLPVITTDSSLPGKLKIPQAFQRTSLPPTALSSDSYVSPLSRSTLLQSRYTAYNRTLSSRSLQTESSPDHKPLMRQSSDRIIGNGSKKDVVEPLDSARLVENEPQSHKKNNADIFVSLRRHSDGNQKPPPAEPELSGNACSADYTEKTPNNQVETPPLSSSNDGSIEQELVNNSAKTVPKIVVPNTPSLEEIISQHAVLPDKQNTTKLTASPKPRKPIVTVEVIKKETPASKAHKFYPGELNPFGDEDAEVIYPDDLNPFEDSEEEEDEFKIEQPRSIQSSSRNSSSLQLSLHGSDYDEALNPFCDSEDEMARQSPNSLRSSGKMHTSRKKKPPPPTPMLSALVAMNSPPRVSSPSVSPCSSMRPSPRSQKRAAPKPPAENQAVPTDLSKNPEEEKATKEQNNLSIAMSQGNKNAEGEMKNVNTFGYWKRKKRPAPSVPVPKRQIRHIPLKEIQEELEVIEEKQGALEEQGRELEMTIRDEPDTTEGIESNEDLIVQLFDLINQKNNLFRRQAELMYIKRSQNLEEEQAELEYQIRCLMSKPEKLRSEADVAKEEELLQRLIEVVEHRNEIVESMEMDRQRVQDEDLSIQEQFSRQPSSGELNEISTLDRSGVEEKTKKKKSKLKDKFKKEKDPNKKSSEDGKKKFLKKDKKS